MVLCLTSIIARLGKLPFSRDSRSGRPASRRAGPVARQASQAFASASRATGGETNAQNLSPPLANPERSMAVLFARYGDDELALLLDFAGRANAISMEQIARLRAKE
jgi:hypothetical protein